MGMKVAKASAEELGALLDLCSILEAVDRGYYPTAPGADSDDEKAPTFFDEDDTQHLRRFYDLVMEVVKRRPGGIGRAIWGAATVLDPRNEVIDPDAGTVELHPRLVAALAATPLPDGHVAVPKSPEPERIESMALRLDHSHGMSMSVLGDTAGTWRPETDEETERRREANRGIARQLYEEATGQGFYRADTHHLYSHLVPPPAEQRREGAGGSDEPSELDIETQLRGRLQ